MMLTTFHILLWQLFELNSGPWLKERLAGIDRQDRQHSMYRFFNAGSTRHWVRPCLYQVLTCGLCIDVMWRKRCWCICKHKLSKSYRWASANKNKNKQLDYRRLVRDCRLKFVSFSTEMWCIMDIRTAINNVFSSIITSVPGSAH